MGSRANLCDKYVPGGNEIGMSSAYVLDLDLLVSAHFLERLGPGAADWAERHH